MSQNVNQSIADNIRKIRTLKGLDAKTIADHLGITASAYAKLERGETQIDIECIAAIADKLGVNTSDILSFSPKNIFEKIDQSTVNVDIQNQYSIPKEIIDSLTEQLKAKDEQIKEQQKIIAKLLGS